MKKRVKNRRKRAIFGVEKYGKRGSVGELYYFSNERMRVWAGKIGEVKKCYTEIIEAGVFIDSEGNPYAAAKEAKLIERNVTVYEID